MIFRARTLIILCGLLIGSWLTLKTYHYFFDSSCPKLELRGLDTDGYYAGNMQCILSGHDDYKVSNISVWLDNAPLINKFKISRREFEHPFTISTQALTNGKHTLKVEAVNGTFKRNKTVEERTFYIDNTPLQAAFVRADTDLKVFQGRTLHVQFQVNKDIKTAQVRALSKTFDCFPESKHSSIYEAYIPIPCEENPNEYLFSINVEDRVGNTQTLEQKFQVIMFPFKKGTVALDPEVVKREAAIPLTQKHLTEAIEQIASNSPKEKLWHGAFCVPLETTTQTADFGAIRTTREKGRYMHKAVDLGGKSKSVVWAAQDGVVAIKDRFAQYGNTVVVDHGFGVCTLYSHLDSFSDITVGQRIEKGNPIGVMGKTGFATGEHLHWELLVNGIQVDPMQWTKQSF